MNTYHLCKNGQQRPGRREDCARCNPVAHKTNEIIIKQTARVAELEAFVREALMNCSIDNHGGGEDANCQFCAKGNAIVGRQS
jgi:hypothetical protein